MANWNEVKNLKDRVESEILKLTGVNYFDIETDVLENGTLGEATLIVGVEDKQLINVIEDDINHLVEGCAVRIVQFKIELLQGNESSFPESINTGSYHPLLGGTNIGVVDDGKYGTLGMCFPFSSANKKYAALSNEHVVKTNSPVSQPQGFPRIMESDSRGVMNTQIDANLCFLDPAYTSFATQEVLGVGVINQCETARIGLNVTKVGARTGKTASTIMSITGTIFLKDYGITLVNQIIVTSSESAPFLDKGDSGSVLLSSINWSDAINPHANVTGLMFSKGTINENGKITHIAAANQIQAVTGFFDVSLDGSVPFYMFYNELAKDHFYSTCYYKLDGTGGRVGYSNETPECRIWPSQGAQTSERVPFYRYYSESNKDHFYTTSNVTPAGYVYEGIACYVMNKSNNGSYIPLFRYYCPLNGDHYYTTSDATPPHYQSEGVACYVKRI